MAEASISGLPAPAPHPTRKFVDLSGSRHGKLAVLYYAGRKGGHSQWVCSCDCGATTAVRYQQLVLKRTVSCGCERKKGRKPIHGHAKAGHNDSRTYRIWSGMKARCNIPSATGFDRYGSVGVSVCDRWGEFTNFLADMGEAPDSLSLDRIDGRKGYSPENCRWATNSEQARNRLDSIGNRYPELAGESGESLGSKIGLSGSCIAYRLKKGWCLACATTNGLRVVCPHIKGSQYMRG